MEYKNDKGKDVAQNYYEGTLQLRNASEDMVIFVKEKIAKTKNVFIAKESKVRNGYDFLLSSQKFMQRVGRELQKKFGGEYRISRKLFTRDRRTSKEVYRVTVLVRVPKFKVGDVIKARERILKVTIMGKKVIGIDQDTGKKITVDYKFIR